MDPPRWQEVKKVLNAVVDLPSDQRSSYLDAIGAKDPDLRREVQSLLSAHEQAGDDFLQGPRTDEGIHLSKDAQIGTYRIVSFIAAGGMGEVYRARDLRLRRDVAIKVLPALLSSDPDRLRRFEQEASAAASLNHPNILAVFQMGTHEGAPYLVSELLEGETLGERIKRGPMTARDVVDYGTQIAAGLAAAHEKGIIHRDLKPENLFVTKDGQVKILDFGLAKLLQHNSVPIASTGSDRTAPGVVIGTVAYMSSEQALGKELDQRTDLFSFGAVLYEMAAGIPAFRGDTVAAVFDAVLNKTPVAPLRINPDVPAKLAEIISKALEKDRDLRYQSAAEMRTDLQRLKRDTESGEFAAKNDVQLAASGRSLRRWITMVAVAIVAALSGAVYLYRHHSPRPLTDKDTIVLAEFTNSTGDPVFDGTLRQGLSAQLEQSPFLNLLSDQRVGQTLSLMTQPQDARLTPALAREVCQRTASAANIEGSIASLGNQYVLGLKAVNCKSGDVLAEDQVTASGKEQVLKAMGEAATRMREKLGESLASVQKFDVPPENVTTLYLIALQAYSQGVQAHVVKGDSAGAVPFYQRAISLDPNFAMAYARLGTAFSNVGQSVRASENIRKAYELRQRVSEPEKFYIVSHYQDLVTGDLEAARKTYELWGQTYSRTAGNLTIIYRQLGEYEKSLAENKVELQLDPGDGITYQQSVSAFIFLNRLDEAKAMAQEAQARHVDSQQMHHFLYMIAFLQKDAAGMERETKQLSGPSFEELALHDRSDTAAYAGEFATARELTRRAVSSAQRADAKEEAAAYQAESAVREALVGNSVQAKQQVKAALALSSGRDVRGMAAVALGFAGDAAQANRLAGDLAKGFPEDTLVQFTYLPAIRALVELHRGDGAGNAKQAIEALAASTPYELGTDGGRINFALYPVYVRGAAYLAGHQGLAAVAEFEKIRNHPGIVRNEVISSLAHLQLGRAYVLSGETAKAKNAYQNFFALWKAADPEIPILKQADAEYAKLQ